MFQLEIDSWVKVTRSYSPGPPTHFLLKAHYPGDYWMKKVQIQTFKMIPESVLSEIQNTYNYLKQCKKKNPYNFKSSVTI